MRRVAQTNLSRGDSTQDGAGVLPMGPQSSPPTKSGSVHFSDAKAAVEIRKGLDWFLHQTTPPAAQEEACYRWLKASFPQFIAGIDDTTGPDGGDSTLMKLCRNLVVDGPADNSNLVLLYRNAARDAPRVFERDTIDSEGAPRPSAGFGETSGMLAALVPPTKKV